MEGMLPDMQGSKNPLIIRNYRTIFPACYKDISLGTVGNTPYGPGPVYKDDFQLQFKIEAAPIILTYESEFIMRLKFTTSALPNAPYATNVATSKYGDAPNDANQDLVTNQLMAGLLSGISAEAPLIRFKCKSAAASIKRAWCTMSNMTFQSVRTPEYLNEIIQRKPIEVQRKYPDNYTSEYSFYSKYSNPTTSLVRPANSKTDVKAESIVSYENDQAPFSVALGPRGNTWNQWDPISFSTPHVSLEDQAIYYDIRIPLTELLPVFKIGVVPCMMINSSLIDLILDIYHPSKWIVSQFFGPPITMETWLNISTVSFPDINPMAEMVLKPKLAGDRFLAPFLDYFTVEKTLRVRLGAPLDFHFNVIQFFRNVPFFSLSFLDLSSPAAEGGDSMFISPAKHFNNLPFLGTLYPNGNMTADVIKAGPMFDVLWGLSPSDRERGGFYSLPPGCSISNLKIMLGESAFPLTQFPMSFNDMYMYNRKHFEMYGRDYNVTRVCPISRHRHGDASYFFDISHGPFSGFTIDSDSPLQIIGTLDSTSPYIYSATDKKIATSFSDNFITIKILLTIWYSNNFNAMLNSGGVVPLQ